MDGVTLREASETLPELVARVEQGEDVVILRDGVPVARLVREAPQPAAPAKRVLTPEQRKALDESIAWAMQPRQLAPWAFDRDALYDDRGG
ncbi:type II toxin-antitoxin system Phd/YefM family antitoxin [Roseomonas sp. AR75]|uniref:type II toxin-antitoxin system Phd/YefM family antitoxin n=1 Tax=Roseomonas sp. AR75 TaxID=2562311 RepID=UPI0010BF7DAC|nr:type II toxin-antitoxin system prevent-host-death family antitoxin [Roseomonas sp. AR75]